MRFIIEKNKLIVIFSLLTYLFLLLIIFPSILLESDAAGLYTWVSHRFQSFTSNPSLILIALPWLLENAIISALSFIAQIFSGHINEFNFSLITSLLTFIFSIYIAYSFSKYNGLKKNESLISALITCFIFGLTPIGKLGLINTQSSFIAIQLAFTSFITLKPRFIYVLFHWSYIPFTLLSFVIDKLMYLNLRKLIYIPIKRLLLILISACIGIIFMSLYKSLDFNQLLIDTGRPSQFEIIYNFAFFIVNLNLNFIFLFLKTNALNKKILVFSIISFLISFLSIKTANRLFISITFYNISFIVVIFFNYLKALYGIKNKNNY